MAGLADGSASLSMSGREELMALKQAGCYSLSLFFPVCLYVSLFHTRNTFYILYLQGLN